MFAQKIKQAVGVTEMEEFVIITFIHNSFSNGAYDRNEAFKLVMKECKGIINPKPAQTSLDIFEEYLSFLETGLFQC
jgi:hypothetical protein